MKSRRVALVPAGRRSSSTQTFLWRNFATRTPTSSWSWCSATSLASSTCRAPSSHSSSAKTAPRPPQAETEASSALSTSSSAKVRNERGVPLADVLLLQHALISPRYPAEKGVVFGSPLTESCIAQIYQLIEYLTKSESAQKNTPHTLRFILCLTSQQKQPDTVLPISSVLIHRVCLF